jgi:quercetin dioxygenase-like cupin family protein
MGLSLLLGCGLLFGVQRSSDARQEAKPSLIALKTGEPVSLDYDAGTVRILASSEDTNAAWSLVELVEMPGYRTRVHRHNHTDEAFYVVEGVLSVNLHGKTSEYPAGSYLLIPRGTPHAQGNLGEVPVKLLLTVTPSGFERSFVDRAALFRTMRPDHPDFRKKRQENAKKWNYDVEFLNEWDVRK